jgi:hypothetical protein
MEPGIDPFIPHPIRVRENKLIISRRPKRDDGFFYCHLRDACNGRRFMNLFTQLPILYLVSRIAAALSHPTPGGSSDSLTRLKKGKGKREKGKRKS